MPECSPHARTPASIDSGRTRRELLDAGADDVLATITRGRLGIALVSDDRESAVGIITDGGLRRTLQVHQADVFRRTAADLMTPRPVTTVAESNMQTAIELMARHGFASLVVVDDERVVGVVQKSSSMPGALAVPRLVLS